MLIITFQNRFQTLDDTADYDVVVRVNSRVIFKTEIIQHKRTDGWQKLVEDFTKNLTGETN